MVIDLYIHDWTFAEKRLLPSTRWKIENQNENISLQQFWSGEKSLKLATLYRVQVALKEDNVHVRMRWSYTLNFLPSSIHLQYFLNQREYNVFFPNCIRVKMGCAK